MNKLFLKPIAIAVFATIAISSCGVPKMATSPEKAIAPKSFSATTDTTNTATVAWKVFFKDPNLTALIDIALQKNQDLLTSLQDIEIAKNDIRVRKGLLLPSVSLGAGAGIEKVGRFIS